MLLLSWNRYSRAKLFFLHRAFGRQARAVEVMQDWPANENEVRTPTGTPIDVRTSCMGSLRNTFSNIPQRAQTLVTRWRRGVYRDQHRAAEPRISDARGPLARRIETAQTFLTDAEIDNLIGDYLGGASINHLAQQYGIHCATVFAHLRRRNTPRRRLGLDVDEGAEAVRLFRGGVSMRAIGRRMGVGRKAVRTALVEAGLIVDDSSDGS